MIERTRRLTAEDITAIKAQIAVHPGRKFGWTDVVEISAKLIHGGFTRQALANNHDIKLAYHARKAAARPAKRYRNRTETEISLRAELARLKARICVLEEQVHRQQVNAWLCNISPDRLNRPLSPVRQEVAQSGRKARQERATRTASAAERMAAR